MMRKPQKPPEGAKKPETADMAAWRKDFEKMKVEDHLEKLAALGLDDEDLKEFKEMKSGVPIEKEILADEGSPAQEVQKPVKKAKK
ncbi:MAG: hypothetical protein NTZ73_02480 [Candidatus Diapherotrites archaeon]|nr:hypothetical protein [Candidatus Diapherotrites archaeon]